MIPMSFHTEYELCYHRKESILAREERIEAALKNIEDQLDEWIRKRDELQLQQTAIASFNNSKQ
jgi:hypothetical protein